MIKYHFMRDKNPFVIYGYDGPECFCDRELETEKLVGAIENGRNVALLAERRMGKTGLVKHLFGRLDRKGEWATVYVDIFATSNLVEFTRHFAAAVVGSMDSRLDKAIVTATRFFKSFRPEITVDAATGSPSLSFGLDSHNVEATLKECFDYLRQHGKCVVAIDEFQQIGTYPEKGTEALLRSYIQFLPQTRFIFAGSRHHMMVEMFSSAKRPFFNSTQTLPLDRIDKSRYFEFAREKMSPACVLSRETFDRVYSMFDGITWYVQMLMNRMYERASARVEDIGPIVDDLLHEKSWEYAALVKSLPSGASRLLKAVSKADKARSVTGAEFIAENSLRGSSSVHISLKKLVEDEFLYETDDGYVVYDRLLGFWLARL